MRKKGFFASIFMGIHGNWSLISVLVISHSLMADYYMITLSKSTLIKNYSIAKFINENTTKTPLICLLFLT